MLNTYSVSLDSAKCMNGNVERPKSATCERAQMESADFSQHFLS